MSEGPGGQPAAQGEPAGALVGIKLGEHCRVVGRVHHHQHRFMILRGRAHHGRSADIDIVDRVVIAAVGSRHRGSEGIKIDGQQIDGFDVVRTHHRFIETAPSQEAAVNLWMKGLDAAAHDFREAGVLGDFFDRDAVARQQFSGAAGRQELDAAFFQFACEFNDAGLIGNTE